MFLTKLKNKFNHTVMYIYVRWHILLMDMNDYVEANLIEFQSSFYKRK